MGGEEAVNEADANAEKEPKAQTQKTRTNDEPAIEPGETITRIGKRQGQSGGDEHHAGDGADSEQKQIENGPLGLANCA